MSVTKMHHIATTRTGRYYTLGELNNHTKNIWIVLHGYGQLAEYFIRNFTSIQNSANLIVAPEALSRYYLNENTGRIGATWMTKEDRDNEIKDYLEYLDRVIESLRMDKTIQLHILGFSQGSATACRWSIATKHPVKTLVCWAGFFPPDMNWDSQKYLAEEMQTYLVYGNHDVYVNDAMKNQIENLINILQKKPNIITFEGGHEIVPSALNNLVKSIENG